MVSTFPGLTIAGLLALFPGRNLWLGFFYGVD